MQLTGPQIISELRSKLAVDVGRHLYGILGTYQALSDFTENDLANASLPSGEPYPKPINVNRELLARIEDKDLRKLVAAEAKRPQTIKTRLQEEFDGLLMDKLSERRFIILENPEVLFAYDLDVSALRRHATNQNHILLLLPGQKQSDRIVLFHEADERFQYIFPNTLITEQHLWELLNG